MSDDKKRVLNKRLLFIPLALLLTAGLIIVIYRMADHGSLVPRKIQSSVNFPIYYPSLKKLPAGYAIDTKSFRLAQPGVVLFAIKYGKGKDIVFSEEQQPSSNDINKFISSYIPVNTPITLKIGQARLGAYGNAPNLRTVVSLPINKGPWLIITAPANANHNALVNIIKSLTK